MNSMRVRVRALVDTPVYAVTYASMGTPANARVQAFLNAFEVPFSQTAIVQQNKVAVIENQQTSGTNGGGGPAGSWDQRALNAIDDPFGIVSNFTGSRFTLPKGRYYIEAEMRGFQALRLKP